MKTVYKFPIPTSGKVNLPIPSSAYLCHVADQGGELCLWVRMDTDDPINDGRMFQVIGTGQEVPDPAMYHGTALLQNGALVLHVFEVFR